MSDEHDSVDEAEQTGRASQPSADPRASDEDGEDAPAQERTSPFPYAQDVDEWVADETTARERRRDRSAAGDADSRPGRT